MTNKFLYNFISKNKCAVLSTVSKDDLPEAALVGIAVTKDLKIIFDTVSDSRKYKNLIKNPSIAFVIGWNDETTLQYEGIAKIPSEKELEKFLKIYFKVFPDGKERKENWKNIAYFYVEPKWIRYSDFKVEGKIEEKFF
ncbi:MAG: pyridoxamine 5'-phosphate oxidase family protein [Ignavibacteriaceae bacterium]